MAPPPPPPYDPYGAYPLSQVPMAPPPAPVPAPSSYMPIQVLMIDSFIKTMQNLKCSFCISYSIFRTQKIILLVTPCLLEILGRT